MHPRRRKESDEYQDWILDIAVADADQAFGQLRSLTGDTTHDGSQARPTAATAEGVAGLAC